MNRPESNWYPSPNFTPQDPGREISCVIIHATSAEKAVGSLEWLCNPESKVSAHYLIDTDGTLWHLVHEQNLAWHAGQSIFNGLANVNHFSVGIELVNPNDGKTEYPEAQLSKLAELVSTICQEHKILTKAVVGHADIAPGRKNDPLGFPWDTFRARLIGLGVSA